MDLFFRDQTEPVEGDWNLGKPDGDKCKLLVKLKDGSETYAYFYGDGGRMSTWTYPSYFWRCDNKEPIDDVEGWKFLKNGQT
jgi:hypothetical protein